MPLLDPEVSDKLGMLQLLDDATAFRSGRLEQPCPDCRGRRKCTDHAFDQHLVEAYKARYAAAWAEAFTAMDPGDVGELMQADDMPTTAVMLGAAIAARLREAAASGPVVTELDGQLVVIELDGQDLIEHQLLPGGNDSPPPAPGISERNP